MLALFTSPRFEQFENLLLLGRQLGLLSGNG